MGRLEDIEAQIAALTGEREATAEESALRDAQLERLDYQRRIELLELSEDSLCFENATLQEQVWELTAQLKEIVEDHKEKMLDFDFEDAGTRPCCYRSSLQEHREDCWVVKAQALLQKINTKSS